MSNRFRVILAFFIALGMLLFSYWITNQRLIVSGETGLMRNIELVKGWFSPHINPMADSVLLINVSYDPTLVGVHDSYGVPAGLSRITDRQKLLQLLTELKHRNDYKHIMLDVIFYKDDDTQTDVDSALFETICSMKRIVIPMDFGMELAAPKLYDKAGLANYFINYKFVSFAKYPYLVDGQKSMPLRMYETVTGRHIEEHGIFSAEGYRLVRKSIVLPFELRCDSAYTENGEKVWYNLGMDLLGSEYVYGNDTIRGSDELYQNPDLTKDKYIVIGAFSEGDMHYSYLENQPGPAIAFNAYLSLLHGHHYVSFSVFLLLFTAFFILSYYMLGQEKMEIALAGKKLSSNGFVKAGQRVVVVIVSWIGYSMFLTILCAITYIFMGEVYDIFITATLLQLLSILIKQLYKYKIFKHE